MNITFDRRIESCFSPQHLWNLVVDAFRDSTGSPLWPNHLESLRCEQLEPGETVHATYHVGPFDLPQTYSIPTCDADSRTLTYRTGEDHPLDGGGELRVVPTDRGSALVWSGSYEAESNFDAFGAALFVKTWFERRFFDALESNLRRLERLSPPDELRYTA